MTRPGAVADCRVLGADSRRPVAETVPQPGVATGLLVSASGLDTALKEVSLPVFSDTGTFSVKAVYVGDDKLLPSTSPIVRVKVSS